MRNQNDRKIFKVVEGVPIPPPRAYESVQHVELKERAVKFLRHRGFTKRGIKVEYRVWHPELECLSARGPFSFGEGVIDVVGLKRNRRIVAIEVGECRRLKLVVLAKYWPEVYHWPYGADEPIRFVPTEDDKRWLKEKYKEVRRKACKAILSALLKEDPEVAKKYEKRCKREGLL